MNKLCKIALKHYFFKRDVFSLIPDTSGLTLVRLTRFFERRKNIVVSYRFRAPRLGAVKNERVDCSRCVACVRRSYHFWGWGKVAENSRLSTPGCDVVGMLVCF